MSTVAKFRALLTPAEQKGALFLLFLMMIGMVLETLGVGLVVPAIALIMQGDLSSHYSLISGFLHFTGHPTKTQLISVAMVGLIGIYLVKNLFLALLIWRQTHFTFDIQSKLSQRLFTAYLRQPYTFHLQRNSAQLLRNVIGEVNIFANAVSSALMLVTEGMVLVGILILLLIVEPVGALFVILILGTAAWGFLSFTRARIVSWGTARQRHDGLRIQHIQQGLGGVKDVKLLGRERDFLMKYRLHSLNSARAGELQSTLQQLPRLFLEFLAVAGLGLLMLSMMGRGLDMASIVPTLGLFAAAAFRLMPSVNRVLTAVQNLRFGLPVINTLHEEFKLVVTETDHSERLETASFNRELRLSQVSYTYPGAATPALKDLSIIIRKGESVGLIGTSGSGKSTLVDLILGLLIPTGGEFEIDGKQIGFDLRNWQNQIGYVPQSIYLTDDTLRRNIAFGLADEEIDNEAVLRAIKASQLEVFVKGLPDGIDSLVGERGVRLSGGQRQRIGIARALYHDPSILILDEATSALDTATEAAVMDTITDLQGKKTILIVAHRLSTVERCNRIYRLGNGKVVAEGVPADMLGLADMESAT